MACRLAPFLMTVNELLNNDLICQDIWLLTPSHTASPSSRIKLKDYSKTEAVDSGKEMVISRKQTVQDKTRHCCGL